MAANFTEVSSVRYPKAPKHGPGGNSYHGSKTEKKQRDNHRNRRRQAKMEQRFAISNPGTPFRVIKHRK